MAGMSSVGVENWSGRTWLIAMLLMGVLARDVTGDATGVCTGDVMDICTGAVAGGGSMDGVVAGGGGMAGAATQVVCTFELAFLDFADSEVDLDVT